MTTEILRSMLYRGADIIRDIEWVKGLFRCRIILNSGFHSLEQYWFLFFHVSDKLGNQFYVM